ncbi:hypothetical protein [Paracoccus haeundaensis]|uniref:Uncharacterized protein n=1 Tax=Paracoccus haeundaensis TaxID=225362 RepID=A0A5C4R1C7_9RHOB|nr:hypothetical protein [Paracoccus haeundaensis]TNH37641.1 hypothetical protein FHD67_19245 [Paracoccus haeundaensis]
MGLEPSLPSVLWATAGIKVPDINSYRRIAALRNQVQHFVDDRDGDVQFDCLNFIYSNIDPLLSKHFGIVACEFHEDEFNDYVIGCLLNKQIKFTVPRDVVLHEIDPHQYLQDSSKDYKSWAYAALNVEVPN